MDKEQFFVILNVSSLPADVLFACVQTSPISFVARGKGTFPFPRATKEIGDVCTQANVLWGSFVTRDKRTPKDVCGEATM